MTASELTIRKAEPRDAFALIALAAANWPGEERILDSLPRELSDAFAPANFRTTFLVAEQADAIVGFGAWNWSSLNFDVYELIWGNVAADHRGKGIGRALVEARIADIRSIAVDDRSYVLTSTHRPEIYARYGFTSVCTMELWQSPFTHLMIRRL